MTSKTTNKFSPEVRARAVRLVLDHESEHASVQMFDTSIVRVHQYASCIAKSESNCTGRSRGGLTTKIHAVVDAKGLPIRLALKPDSWKNWVTLTTLSNGSCFSMESAAWNSTRHRSKRHR